MCRLLLGSSISMLFDDSVSTGKAIYCRFKWEDDLFKSIPWAFLWKDKKHSCQESRWNLRYLNLVPLKDERRFSLGRWKIIQVLSKNSVCNSEGRSDYDMEVNNRYCGFSEKGFDAANWWIFRTWRVRYLSLQLVGSKLNHHLHLFATVNIRGCTQKFPDWVDNEINNNNKHSLRSNTKDYGAKTH
jgi:hypothetical protein